MKPRRTFPTGRLVAVAVSRLVGLIILCVALVLSLCIGSSPRIESNGLVTAQNGIKSVNTRSLDVMPNVKGLPFDVGNSHTGLIKDEAAGRLPAQIFSERANITPESGSSESGFSPNREMVINQPTNHSANGGPNGYLKWGYEHFLLSGIVSFMIGFFAREFLPNAEGQVRR